MTKKIYILISLIVCAMTSLAQTISVSAPANVETGEQFRVRYTIQTQDVKGFRGGEFPDGLQVLMGPSMSSQSSFQMVNGHTSSSSSITYTYIVYADKPGTYTIPSATAEISGKRVTSHVAHIKVTGQPQADASNSRRQQDRQVQQAGSPISNADLFIKVSANKTRVHEQEPILLTYKLYTLVDVTGLIPKMPDLKGFHSQEVDPQKQRSFHVETINGRPYRCTTCNEYVLYPQMTGKLEIPSITFKGTVVQVNRNVDPFEAFFNGGSGYIEVKKDIIAPGLTIDVLPLPTRPAGFSGGVGTFSISTSLDKETVAANEPVTLRVVVSGTGNLKLLKQPVINFPKDFDKYDPKTTDKTKLSRAGLDGSMIYDYLFVPRNQGEHTIPPVELTYYDVTTNTFKTIKSQPQTITVTPGSTSQSSTVADYTEKDTDIRGIKLSEEKTLPRDVFFATTAYNILIAVILAAFIILIVIFRKRAIANADIVGKRGRKANKVATKRLKKAARLMKEEKYDEFYDEVLRALWGYISDKMNIPVSELSRENITERMQSHNVYEDLISIYVDAIDECEYARYAPGEVHGKMTNVYEKAMRGITDIDDFLKGKRKKEQQQDNHRDGQYNCMKKSFPLFILLMTLLTTNAAANTKSAADEAYSKGNYQAAIRTYELLLQRTPSAELYYNLGNAYFRTDNIPQAIIAYEKASMLLPADADIRHNLSVARSKTIDKMQPRQETFLTAWWQNLVNLMNPNGWAVCSIISLILVIAFSLIYLFVDIILLRQVGFYGGVLCLLIFIISNICAYSQYLRLNSDTSAVIVKTECHVKRSPELKAVDEVIVHEGTHLTITDETIFGWYEVTLDDGTEGWVTTDGIERITLASKVESPEKTEQIH